MITLQLCSYLFDLDCSAVTLIQFVSLTFGTGNTQILEDVCLDKLNTTDSFMWRIQQHEDLSSLIQPNSSETLCVNLKGELKSLRMALSENLRNDRL